MSGIVTSATRCGVAVWCWPLLLLAGWGLLYVPGLGTRELQGEEARRILPGRTMVQTGDWLVPRSAGRVYNRKPPLINWTSALAIRLTGEMNEWTTRFPSALAMLALSLMVWGAGRSWLGDEGAFLAACATLTHVGFLEKGRLAEIEALYIAFFGMGLVVWLAAWWRNQPWMAWSLGMLLMGIAFLAKGPLHVWYFYAVIGGVLWAEGRMKELWSRQHAVGFLLFIGVWMPWALMSRSANPEGDSDAVWLDQLTSRLGWAEFDWINWLFQIPQSLINLLPWVVLLPLAWYRPCTAAWAQMGRKGQWLRGLRAGLTLGFLVIALLPSSRPRFMLPLNVPTVLLMIGCWQLMTKEWQIRVTQRWLGFLRLLTVGVGSAAVTAPWWWGRGLETSMNEWALAVSIWGASLWYSRRLRSGLTSDQSFSPGVVLGLGHLSLVGAGVLLLGSVVAPLTTERDQLRPFAAEIMHHTGSEPNLVLFKLDERMWPFYLGMGCREIADLSELPKRAHWVMVKEEDRERRRGEMERRFGPIQQEISIQEPVTGDAGGKGTRYVLLEFSADNS